MQCMFCLIIELNVLCVYSKLLITCINFIRICFCDVNIAVHFHLNTSMIVKF